MDKICLNCDKLLKGEQQLFCGRSCAATFNNARRSHNPETRAKISGSLKAYWKEKGVLSEEEKKRRRKKQSKIERKRAALKCLYDLGTRTRKKMLLRMGLVRCVICGWDEATCDVHHINGRGDEHSNLIMLCPNHHRVAEEGGLDLAAYPTLADILPENWRDYYYDHGSVV